MIYGILLFLLILVSVILVMFVLMQSDKGGGLAGSLGGMGGGGMPFSGREAATILTKGTTGLAIAFMVICIALSLMSKNRASSVSSNSSLQKRAEKLKAIESNAASSVLDRQGGMESILPSQPADAGVVPAEEGNAVTVPGLPPDQK
jgi:preprotein translocase subunit SecG